LRERDDIILQKELDSKDKMLSFKNDSIAPSIDFKTMSTHSNFSDSNTHNENSTKVKEVRFKNEKNDSNKH